MSTALTILIVNFNSGAYLDGCLQSIVGHAPEAGVLVIDNASKDGSERAADAYPNQVRLHRNLENVGFARAVNRALTLTSGEEVLLLNPDCRLLAGAAETLSRELALHPECAVVGPQILDEDGGVQGSARGDPTLLTGLFGRSSLLTTYFPSSRFARRNIRTGTVGPGGEASVEVDWVSGACMLMRRQDLNAVGGFDERFFLYWEDADLCRRMRQRRYTVRYVPTARVIHRVGGSSRTARPLAIRAFHRSAYTYYSSHVARTPVQRTLARFILEARCQWKLMSSRLGRDRPTTVDRASRR